MDKFKDCLHELKEGEIWVGNTGTEVPYHYRTLKTVRIGEQAYSIDGKPLERNYMRPLIISFTNGSEKY